MPPSWKIKAVARLRPAAPSCGLIVLRRLRSAISGEEERLGFTITPRKSRRVGPLKITDLDFAVDIALDPVKHCVTSTRTAE